METKPWFTSLTIDAALVGAILGIIKIFGVDVGAWVAESEPIAAAITGGIALFASVMAIYGRIKAAKKITPT